MKGQKKAAYVSIALDIANKILNGEFREKQKISGRSTLASMYNVSPETIRRAIVLLEEMDVVNSNRGSGIDVISKTAAEKFIEIYDYSMIRLLIWLILRAYFFV